MHRICVRWNFLIQSFTFDYSSLRIESISYAVPMSSVILQPLLHELILRLISGSIAITIIILTRTELNCNLHIIPLFLTNYTLTKSCVD